MPEVLVVCTANICRSPMAAALLRAYVDAHAPDHAEALTVTSAGLHAREGHAATDHMRAIADQWGLDLDAHRSRRLTAQLATAATLVVTMERAHRDDVARLAPGLAQRTFTLPELGALVDHVPAPDGDVDGHGLDHLARALHHARARVWTDTDDVEDPFGGPVAGYHATATELVDHVERVGPAIVAHLTGR